MKEKQFVTADIYLASAISILTKTYPDFIVKNEKTLFVFLQNENLFRAISEYNNDVPLCISQYVEILKKLKVEMLTRKRHGGAWINRQ